MESDATSRTPDSSVSFEIPLTVTRDENHVADEDTEDAKNQGQVMVRSTILLQLDKVEETHRSCMARYKYNCGLCTPSH